MQKFKVTYTNGFELIEAESIWEAMTFLKRQHKLKTTSTSLPVAIELVGPLTLQQMAKKQWARERKEREES